MVKKLLKAVWSGFRCLFEKHFYHPSCETLTLRPTKLVKYTCVHCGAVTKWMTEAEHQEFKEKENPRLIE